MSTRTDGATAPSIDGSEGGFVDWQMATRIGSRVAPPGPSVDAAELTDLVATLRAAADRAVDPVAATTGMQAPQSAPRPLIVDRPGWISANVASLESMLAPVLAEVAQRQSPGRVSGRSLRWGATVAATEVGGMMSWLSTKVLGQYDLAPHGTPRLLLVAPNVLTVERELEVDSADFRLWVCLHEETHRLQFTAVPWLREHLIDSARRLGTDLVPGQDDLGERMQQLFAALPGVLRGEIDITQVLATPEQREQLAQVTAVMSLLEGHADVVMDEVGPQVVPTVATIRARFDWRRRGTGALDRLLRRLLGLEAKTRQYRDGAGFVRGVIDQVGMDGLNAVWSDAATLPRPSEIADPATWVARVHG